jgi:hypothetical protein
MRRLATAGIGALAVAGTSVLAGTGAASAAAPGVPGTLPSTVSLTVLQPTPYEVITGSLPIQVAAQGYLIDARYAGTPDSSVIGHYHEYLDGHLVDMTPYRDGNRDTMPMTGVADGLHTLTLIPANNDHSTVGPGVSTPFYYEGPYQAEPTGYTGVGAPGVTITSPANGSTAAGDYFTMTAHVSNFVLCGTCFGKGDVAGEGHWHIFLDQVNMARMLTMAGGPSQVVSLKGVTPGWHTFYAVLVGNDHMPLMPMTISSVRLFVQSSG